MPELPEVETIRRELDKSIRNKIIDSVLLCRKDLRIKFPDRFSEKLIGRKILSVSRRAKYLLIELNDKNILVIHLGMSGKILVKDHAPDPLGKHDHVVIRFKNGSVLIYNDTRRFGLMTLVPNKQLKEHELFRDLGPEPFSGEFDAKYLLDKLKNRTAPIKNILMDNRVVVGVGNIYTCESLFRSHISPIRKGNTISSEKANSLVKNIRDVLKEAIDSGGSTLRDYARSDGDSGYFQHKFKVYGREKQSCYNCGSIIKRIVQQGRSTFYCPNCQK